MDSVLIASNTPETMGIISSLLQSRSFDRIVTSQSGSQARRDIMESDFDLIIIDTPLTDEFGDDFSIHAAEHSTAGIILIVDSNHLYDVSDIVEDSGVFVLPKPVSPEYFYQAAKLMESCRKRVFYLENQNQKLQHQIQEIRTVDRAKLVLIQVLNMTEAQAHKYIERQAMDLRQSKLQTAENILRTYEI
ncbi:MAG: ANTAR domain-containing protein [Treponema sp.]|nr:ANTAR domain-containing protein [Treponema sp.]